MIDKFTPRAVPLGKQIWIYTAPTGPAARRRRDYRLPDGRRAVILTERGGEEGMSLTNAAAEVYAELATEMPGERIELVEHRPAGWAGGEHFDSVDVVAGRPSWQRLRVDDVLVLFGPGVFDGSPLAAQTTEQQKNIHRGQ